MPVVIYISNKKWRNKEMNDKERLMRKALTQRQKSKVVLKKYLDNRQFHKKNNFKCYEVYDKIINL